MSCAIKHNSLPNLLIILVSKIVVGMQHYAQSYPFLLHEDATAVNRIINVNKGRVRSRQFHIKEKQVAI
jgi:hypothetical protein